MVPEKNIFNACRDYRHSRRSYSLIQWLVDNDFRLRLTYFKFFSGNNDTTMWTRHPAADGVRGAMRILPRLTLTLETYTETWDLFPAGLIIYMGVDNPSDISIYGANVGKRTDNIGLGGNIS